MQVLKLVDLKKFWIETIGEGKYSKENFNDRQALMMEVDHCLREGYKTISAEPEHLTLVLEKGQVIKIEK